MRALVSLQAVAASAVTLAVLDAVLAATTTPTAAGDVPGYTEIAEIAGIPDRAGRLTGPGGQPSWRLCSLSDAAPCSGCAALRSAASRSRRSRRCFSIISP